MGRLVALMLACGCGRIGFDATTGANDANAALPPNGDADGDGLVNVDDNCPTLMNPMQYNEDADRYGDECDPCPPFADDIVDDPDGDRVSGVCDPYPTTTGDRIVLFEGFHGTTQPAGWTLSGTWTWAGGDAETFPSANVRADLTAPVAVDDASTSSAGIVATQINGGALDIVGFGLIAPGTANQGLGCLFFFIGGSTSREGGIVDVSNFQEINADAFPWQTGELYAGFASHTATTYSCRSITSSVGPLPTLDASRSPIPANNAVIGTSSVSIQVRWFMHVDSP